MIMKCSAGMNPKVKRQTVTALPLLNGWVYRTGPNDIGFTGRTSKECGV